MPVGKTPGNLLEQVHLLGNFPEKQTSKVSGDPLGAELGFDAAIAEVFKRKLLSQMKASESYTVFA
jgi:hypothetical protein